MTEWEIHVDFVDVFVAFDFGTFPFTVFLNSTEIR